MRNLLAGKARLAGTGKVFAKHRQFFGLASLVQDRFQFELLVEMVFDHAFVPASDEDEMLDARFACLVNDMLDQRTVDHRQHFFRHRLCGWQKTRAKPCHGKDGFSNRFVHDGRLYHSAIKCQLRVIHGIARKSAQIQCLERGNYAR